MVMVLDMVMMIVMGLDTLILILMVLDMVMMVVMVIDMVRMIVIVLDMVMMMVMVLDMVMMIVMVLDMVRMIVIVSRLLCMSTNQVLGVRKPGEMCIRGPKVNSGYLNHPKVRLAYAPVLMGYLLLVDGVSAASHQSMAHQLQGSCKQKRVTLW
jgi:hypothetical protein